MYFITDFLICKLLRCDSLLSLLSNEKEGGGGGGAVGIRVPGAL